jgi:RNA polymerase sigma-B factor
MTAGRLVIEYLGLADALARRYRSSRHDPEDLRQVARLGLLKAARRYQQPLGHGFAQYAVPTITGELKRYIRDQSWAVRPPRSLQELRMRLNTLRQQLAQELGHEPTAAELAPAAGVTAREVLEAEATASSMVGRPLDGGEADESDRRPVGERLGREDPGFEQVDDACSLAGALAGITEAERLLLRLRFAEEMTQEQIARELGVSQMQVSRLLRRLITRLRERMRA